MEKLTDSALWEWSRGDSLHAADCAERALLLTMEKGSFEAAHEYAERRVASAHKNMWRSSLYRWAGIVLCFRRVLKQAS